MDMDRVPAPGGQRSMHSHVPWFSRELAQPTSLRTPAKGVVNRFPLPMLVCFPWVAEHPGPKILRTSHTAVASYGRHVRSPRAVAACGLQNRSVEKTEPLHVLVRIIWELFCVRDSTDASARLQASATRLLATPLMLAAGPRPPQPPRRKERTRITAKKPLVSRAVAACAVAAGCSGRLRP